MATPHDVEKATLSKSGMIKPQGKKIRFFLYNHKKAHKQLGAHLELFGC
ncbi:Hypothetical protein Minf_0854 [Methylacidiphilum infernorum V4]|uniref:Uncharacterized protein n=1 Tax=Methylacidiphilum infernorum (isolate V4) TaxID=481448 RepID=B3E1B3_METI4|nr:Hypothetical protein Minf_0854 [Methylacidiphilum infernorum V4]